MTFLKKQECKFNYPVLTMGTFDGVHLGHQSLFKELKKRAELANGEAIVLTYYHHPLETIHRKTFPYLLTEKDKKEELLKKFGIDCIFYLNFNEEMAKLSADEFLKNIIIEEIKAKEIVVGYDTHFGRFREGDYQFLKNNEEKYGYKVDIIEPCKINNRIISSSLIRDFIREGDIQDAAKCLGRLYSISGEVITGHKIGEKIGFPTINIHPHDANKLIPAIGVYICEVVIEANKYFGLTNIGYSPTLKNKGIKEVETHILDFCGNLYNKKVEVFFHKRIREEKLFSSKHELIKEIRNDINKARDYFDM